MSFGHGHCHFTTAIVTVAAIGGGHGGRGHIVIHSATVAAVAVSRRLPTLAAIVMAIAGRNKTFVTAHGRGGHSTLGAALRAIGFGRYSY